MRPNRDAMQQFLDFWFADLPEGQQIHMRYIRDPKDQNGAHNSFHATVADAVEEAMQIKAPWGSFFGAAPRDGKKAGKDGVKWLMGYWCDIDAEAGKQDALHVIGRTPVHPSAIIETPRGYHCYWKFREPEEVSGHASTHERRLEGISVALGGDLACRDISRVMRLPGSIHYKSSPLLVGIHVLQSG